MLKRTVLILLAGLVMLAAAAPPAHAQQTLNFSVGQFTIRGEDARVGNDVLLENRNYLVFDFKDFNGPAVGAEWLIPIGNYIEAGAGVSFYRRTVGTVYADFTHADDREIEQDVRLRVIPVAFTARVLPMGQSSGIQPYFGGGLAVLSWRYSESGEFVDLTTLAIFREQYVASGNATGPIALGGIRFAGESLSAGFEARYQGGDAELGRRFSAQAPDPSIDLGGWTYQATVGIRFGR